LSLTFQEEGHEAWPPAPGWQPHALLPGVYAPWKANISCILGLLLQVSGGDTLLFELKHHDPELSFGVVQTRTLRSALRVLIRLGQVLLV
jgi:hypothetical protein